MMCPLFNVGKALCFLALGGMGARNISQGDRQSRADPALVLAGRCPPSPTGGARALPGGDLQRMVFFLSEYCTVAKRPGW